VPLTEVAPQLEQALDLLRTLDSLRDRAQLEDLAEVDDRPQQIRDVAARTDRADEVTVDLQVVERDRCRCVREE
jgi:hypothetical protein